MARRFKRDAPDYFDYRDPKALGRYVNQYGQIEPGIKSGLKQQQQKRLATAIKRARHLALMPFVATN